MLSGCAREQPALIYKNDASSEMSCRVEWQATEWGWWCRPVPPESLVNYGIEDSLGARWVQFREGSPFYRVVPWQHGGMGCGCP